MDGLSGDRKRAMEEVLRAGLECASQLQAVLDGGDAAAAADLVAEIQKTFAVALEMSSSVGSEEDSQSGVAKHGRSSPGLRRSEDSGESCKSSGKDRRGSYKRRKTTQSWTTTALTQIEDGYAWRKYGQKIILNTKHPRSYYRCTHKYDQGCLATKQVQKTDDEPAVYQITYNNHHTCRPPPRGPPAVLDPPAPPSPCGESSSALSFDHSNGSNAALRPAQLQDLFSFPPPQQQSREETVMMVMMMTANANFALADDGRQPPALDHEEDQDLQYLLSSFDPGDVISATTSADRSLDVDVMAGSYGDFIEDVLHI